MSNLSSVSTKPVEQSAMRKALPGSRNGFGGSVRTVLPVAPPPPPSIVSPSTPSENPQKSIISQSKLFAERQWAKTFTLIDRNPSLVTSGVLILAVKRHAPANLIRVMLKINPDAASIPKQGPSPLQIAVQSQASVEVVQELIRACPFALVATNPGSHLDPLSYAKRFRPTEGDLIRLLSHPVNYWIPEENRNGLKKEIAAVNYSYKPGHHAPKTSNPATSTTTIPHFLQHYTCGSNDDAEETSRPFETRAFEQSGSSLVSVLDPTELNNVKLICLATLKGHKRLTKDMNAVQNQLDEVANASSAAFESASSVAHGQLQMADIKETLQTHTTSMLQKVQEQQQGAARRHIAALNVKEEALRNHMRKREQRILEALEKHKNETAASLEIRLNAIVQALQNRLTTFNNRIESVECRVPSETAAVVPAQSSAVVVSPDIAQRKYNPSNSGHHHQQQHHDQKQFHHRQQQQDHSHRYRNDEKKIQPETNAFEKAAVVSPNSFTYRDAPTFDTFEETSDDGSPMPFVFASPFQKLPTAEDDARSLLTDDSFVERADIQHTRGPRRAMKAGKKLLLVLCKNY